MARFVWKPSRGSSYLQYGLAWFVCKNYKTRDRETQLRILEACRRCGGENARALFEYVTTERDIVSIMRQFHIASETTIYRAAREFYRSVKV